MAISFLASGEIEMKDWNQEIVNSPSYLPVFLYPCRIETRLFPAEGTSQKTIKIRLFPDQIAISNFKRKLTEQEILSGKTFGEVTALEERRIIWRKLANEYGAARAAWIIHSSGTKEKEEQENKLPEFKLLPDFFLVTLYIDNKTVLRQAHRVGKSLSILNVPQKSNSKKDLLGEGAQWLSDFKIAQEQGMAFEFTLNSEIKTIKKITVVGIRDETGSEALVEELFERHHYTASASFIKHDTATNNTDTNSSGFSRKENIENRFEQEFGKQPGNIDSSNAGRMAWALGFDNKGKELLGKWQHGWEKYNYLSSDLHNALWVVTGKYFHDTLLKDSVKESDAQKLRAHFSKYIRPGGLLPSFRIANIPYGLLPVTRLDGWKKAH